jgi:hypothetical protein
MMVYHDLATNLLVCVANPQEQSIQQARPGIAYLPDKERDDFHFVAVFRTCFRSTY